MKLVRADTSRGSFSFVLPGTFVTNFRSRDFETQTDGVIGLPRMGVIGWKCSTKR